MSAVLSYKFPPILSGGGGLRANAEKFQSTLPLNGAIFRSDQSQSIIFNIADNSQFLRTTMSYLAGTIVPKAADGSEATAGTKSSFQGVTRAFSRMQIRFGGIVVEDINFYNDVLALHYATLPQTRKHVLASLEGFGNVDAFSTGKKKFAHALLSSLWVTDQSLPLPLLSSGGVTIELWLAPVQELFTSANVAYYEIQSPVFRWQGLTPSPDYTISLRSAVSSGRSAYIHYQKLHFNHGAGNGSNTQQIQVPLGQISSLASIETVFWDDTAYADRTKDKYSRFHNAKLVDFKIENGSGNAQPSQLTFQYQGGVDPETVLLGLMTNSGNIYTMDRDVYMESDFQETSFRIGMNFQSMNEYAGNGLSLLGAASPFVTITTNHSAPVAPTTRIMTISTVDALIEFRGAEVAISEIF